MLEGLGAAKDPYDIIIVGGGATGLGTAVDASNRGYRVLLVEQEDFAKGTSSRSTKLVHGGVRYLRQGNVSLVLHALKERGLMLQNAPHLVHDLEFMIPGYKWWEAPYYGIGLKVYDRLSGRYSFGRSRMVDKHEAVRRVPTIETDGLHGGVVYHDGQFDDSRLAVNLAQTAVEAGATVLNYVKCVGLIKDSGKIAGILARDTLSGEEHELRACVVINATGVFVDDLMNFDDRNHSPMVTVSQGIHFVLPGEFLGGDCALMVPKTEDGRVLFGIPWHGCVVVGTTDIQVERHSLEPIALQEERDFVMSHARKYLAKDPEDKDVLSVFAGLRPLVRSSKTKSTSRLSRDHTILVSHSGLVTVTGGKWTTYRRMAEDVVNMAIPAGGLEQRNCGTEDLRIHGWTKNPHPDDGLAVYGADAAAVDALCHAEPGMDALLHPDLPYRKGEVAWHARNEMAMTVEDVLARRTRALFLNAGASIEAAADTATLLAGELGYDKEWEQEQVDQFTSMARHYVYTDKASVLATA